MIIGEKFLNLTEYTIPYGYESSLEKYLPYGYKKDKHGNYYLQIGNSDTMFCCHLDTVCDEVEKVNHIFKENIVKTDGTTILGADDKAGMTVLLYMIEHKIPGLYYFFIGEEVGCIGSGNLAFDTDHKIIKNIKKCISFDRRGLNSIITHQSRRRTCSDEFANKLIEYFKLNNLTYEKDQNGIYTDSAEFSSIIPECTNISVGYYNEHTFEEYQDIEHLEKLCKACIQIDWNKIGHYRDITVKEYKNYTHKNIKSTFELEYNELEYNYKELVKVGFNINNYTYLDIDGNGIKKYYISNRRISYEKSIISDYLFNYGMDFSNIIWDGNECYIETHIDQPNELEYIGNRNDLIPYINELISIEDYDIDKDIYIKENEYF